MADLWTKPKRGRLSKKVFSRDVLETYHGGIIEKYHTMIDKNGFTDIIKNKSSIFDNSPTRIKKTLKKDFICLHDEAFIYTRSEIKKIIVG